MSPGPYPWDPAAPAAGDDIVQGDDAIRAAKSTFLTVAQENWLATFPTDGHCTAGWPRVLPVVLKAGLPAASPPYGRLAYAYDTDHLYVETASGWRNAYPAGVRTQVCVTGLTGDGFLANPSLCGDVVHDWFQRPTYRGLFAGRDFPCGAEAAYRAFLRFPILPGPRFELTKVELWLFYAEKGVPIFGLDLYEIPDFGTLDFGDFGAISAPRHAFGNIATPFTPTGQWLVTNVTTRYLQAKTDGLTHLAFCLAQNESILSGGISRWYAIVAADNPGGIGVPRLVYTFNA
jgi:hypothetical protein